MTFRVTTPTGVVTSRRIAWRANDGRNVWSWRCDTGKEPLSFSSVEDAQQWLDEIQVGSPPKERAYFADNWHIEEVPE